MRKLFLTSAGLPKETRDYFIKLLPKKPEDITVAFIPTAAYPKVDKWFVKKALDELKEIGIKQIEEIDLKEENEKNLLEKLTKADVIYVNGGNTFYLLDYVRKSGFNQIINKLLSDGKIYVGVSAGSYIACPKIEMATWKHQDRNRFGLKDLTSLNLVPFLIIAHFEEKYKSIIEKSAKKTKYPVIVLTDKQAVLCIDGKYEIVGKGEKLSYNSPNSS